MHFGRLIIWWVFDVLVVGCSSKLTFRFKPLSLDNFNEKISAEYWYTIFRHLFQESFSSALWDNVERLKPSTDRDTNVWQQVSRYNTITSMFLSLDAQHCWQHVSRYKYLLRVPYPKTGFGSSPHIPLLSVCFSCFLHRYMGPTF